MSLIKKDPSPIEAINEGGRFVHLDAFRVLGVCGVIVAHTSDDYVQANTLLCLNWGMQTFFIIAGTCWAMSSRGVWSYLRRLQMYFCVGTGLNWLAWVIAGLDWRSNMWDVVFQMWFIQFLSLSVLLTAPLKWSLSRPEAAWKVARGYSAAAVIITLVWWNGSLAAAAASVMRSFGGSGAGSYADSAGPILGHGARLVSVLALSSSAYAVLQSKGTDGTPPKAMELLVWLLLVLAYLPAYFVREEFGAFVHDLQLFHISFLAQRFSFLGQARLAVAFHAYWPLLFCPLAFLSVPYMQGRFDLHPPEDSTMRMRLACTDLLLSVVFLSFTPSRPLGNASPVELCSDPYGVLPWLSRWALFAYMAHDAFLRVLPWPWGCVVTFGSAAVFWCQHLSSQPRHRRASEEPLNELSGSPDEEGA